MDVLVKAGRGRRGAALVILSGLLIVILLGVGSDGGSSATLQLTAVPDGWAVVLPVRVTIVSCGLLVTAVGVYRLATPHRVLVPSWALVTPATGAGTLAFLAWAVEGRAISIAALVEATATGALPLLLGALAGVLCERSGVINIAVEGQFLLGAFAASVAASVAGLWVGLLAGSLAGGLLGALLAVLAIRFLADQVIAGFVLNFLVVGLTGFLFTRVIVPNQDSLGTPEIFPPLRVPMLVDLPMIGPVLFGQNVIFYLAVLLLVWVHLGLGHTRWGLRTLATGENPEAAESAGVDVLKIRYRNVTLGGLIAGIGGAYLSIGSVGSFGPNMSAGKGFIALAVLIFGRWNPGGAAVAALLFGLADAVQQKLTILGSPIPSEILQMVPYVVTIIVVAGLVGAVRPPAADGKSFVR